MASNTFYSKLVYIVVVIGSAVALKTYLVNIINKKDDGKKGPNHKRLLGG